MNYPDSGSASRYLRNATDFNSQCGARKMTNGRHDESLIKPSRLDEKQSFEWRHLSMQTVARRLEPRCSSMNETLEFAARREPQSPVAPVYRAWMADNLAQDGRFAEAIVGYDAAI